jgi:hypothetical protein
MKQLLLLSIFIAFSISGCSSGRLVDDIYQHTFDNENRESATAFIILSNIYLSRDDIENIEKDYKNEKNRIRQYYYEYVLAKRTQEEKYITAFIESSKDNINILIENNSNWVSISSPLYKQLAYYSKTNDDALNTLFKLIKISDGANLSIVAEDLYALRETNPARFSQAAQKAGVTNIELREIMENE